MTDEIDHATALSETFRETAVANRERPPAVAATGDCLYCGHEVESGRRWCSSGCRDHWQAEQDQARHMASIRGRSGGDDE